LVRTLRRAPLLLLKVTHTSGLFGSNASQSHATIIKGHSHEWPFWFERFAEPRYYY
jgi:hypothetical protein